MQISNRLMPILFIGVLLAGVGLAASQWFFPKDKATSSSSSIEVTVPNLSAVALEGKIAFDASCARCHGKNGSGTNQGPPLIHDIYNPGHHSDASFVRAVKQGVRQHHWPFGNMPARPEVTDEELKAIIRYVRELQQANGITYRPHRM